MKKYFITSLVILGLLIPSVSFGTTAIFYPSLDGYVSRRNVAESWATLVAGAGNEVNSTNATDFVAETDGTTGTGNFSSLVRGVTLFDTSAIPSNATISSASITFYGYNQSNDLSIAPLDFVSNTITSTSSFQNSDYNVANWGSTVFASSTYANLHIGTSTANVFTLNTSGVANITKGGISKFGFRWDNDISGTAPTWVNGGYSYLRVYMSDSVGTSTDPYLTVTYTVPPVTRKIIGTGITR